MNWSFTFFLRSVLLGAGLAMDAFSVSVANGLHEPKMKKSKALGIAAMFAFFQALMPMLGWVCIKTVVDYFAVFEKFIPWIALLLLLFIGGKMIIEAVKNKDDETETPKVGLWGLIVQGIATSIDALSVGFTIAEYNWLMALVCSLIIAVVTFFICVAGVYIGKKFGMRFSHKAEIAGGIILVLIGLEIFLTGIF